MYFLGNRKWRLKKTQHYIWNLITSMMVVLKLRVGETRRIKGFASYNYVLFLSFNSYFHKTVKWVACNWIRKDWFLKNATINVFWGFFPFLIFFLQCILIIYFPFPQFPQSLTDPPTFLQAFIYINSLSYNNNDKMKTNRNQNGN